MPLPKPPVLLVFSPSYSVLDAEMQQHRNQMRGESAALCGSILMDATVEQTPPVLLLTFQPPPVEKQSKG